MSIFDKLKQRAENKKDERKNLALESAICSVISMEAKYDNDDLVGAAKDLKHLLEYYGTRKKQNHRYKGRAFIHFVLSNKHKDLKNTGYMHWENINRIIQLNQTKVYPYNKENLKKAIDFFKQEVKSINSYSIKVA